MMENIWYGSKTPTNREDAFEIPSEESKIFLETNKKKWRTTIWCLISYTASRGQSSHGGVKRTAKIHKAEQIKRTRGLFVCAWSAGRALTMAYDPTGGRTAGRKAGQTNVGTTTNRMCVKRDLRRTRTTKKALLKIMKKQLKHFGHIIRK